MTRTPASRTSRVATAIGATLLALVTPAAADPTGVLTGTVRLTGAAPARAALPVFKNHEVCGDQVPDERLVVGPGGGIRYAIVTVDGVRGGKAPDHDTTVILDNRECRFQPHVQVAEVGQWLTITNNDPILHNVDAHIGKDPLFNVALLPKGHVRKPLARAGLVSITCDVRHTWESAFVDVAEHRYHTVTDLDGAYEIRDLPPGSYTLRVWHEELGTRTLPFSVKADEKATVDIGFSLPAANATEGAR